MADQARFSIAMEVEKDINHSLKKSKKFLDNLMWRERNKNERIHLENGESPCATT